MNEMLYSAAKTNKQTPKNRVGMSLAWCPDIDSQADVGHGFPSPLHSEFSKV